MQAITGHDDVVQARGQAGYQTVQGLTKERLLRLFIQVGSLLRWVWGEEFLRVRLALGYSPPDSPGDGRDGVSGEGGAPAGVVALERPPQTDAAYLDDPMGLATTKGWGCSYAIVSLRKPWGGATISYSVPGSSGFWHRWVTDPPGASFINY